MEQVAQLSTKWAGSTWAFIIATGVIVIWLLTGPIFNFSDTWQLCVNTGTTIITFLMVFLIQRTQNKESRAIQLKLNELIAVLNGASNRLIGAEDLSEDEVDKLKKRYNKLYRKALLDETKTASHSVEEEEDDEDDHGYAIE